MQNNLPLVSVIVLSHDRPVYLARALNSIAAQSYPNLEIIVVDNKSGSSDEIAGVVRLRSAVKLIQNSANLGFGRGMNRGIAAASGEYVYCSSDELLLDRNCLAYLVEHMQKHPTAGLLSGILYYEGSRTIRCAGGEFALSQIYRRKIFGAEEEDTGQFNEPCQVKFIPGALVFTRLDFIRRLRGFREDFFLYSEDMELCARVLQSGHTITIVPQAKVYDCDAPHAYHPDGINYHKIKNLWAVYLLHARWRVLPEFFLRYGALTLLRSIFFNRKYVWPMIKASGWLFLKMPSLLRERYGSARLYRAQERLASQDENSHRAPTSTAMREDVL